MNSIFGVHERQFNNFIDKQKEVLNKTIDDLQFLMLKPYVDKLQKIQHSRLPRKYKKKFKKLNHLS